MYKEDGCMAVLGLLFIIAMLVGGYYFNKLSCFTRTEGMGFNTTYSYLGGCKIEVEPNKWIPLDTYYFKEE